MDAETHRPRKYPSSRDAFKAVRRSIKAGYIKLQANLHVGHLTSSRLSLFLDEKNGTVVPPNLNPVHS